MQNLQIMCYLTSLIGKSALLQSLCVSDSSVLNRIQSTFLLRMCRQLVFVQIYSGVLDISNIVKDACCGFVACF